jgi:DNA-binding transcriptional ArsR family regulator
MDVSSIPRIAGLIGESGRIRMLTALLDGCAHSGTELAIAAGLSPQSASAHLSKLLAGGLVVSERSGRRRLFRLKNADVAAAIEALGALADDSRLPAVPEMRFARTCYDHLAGVLAIALRDQLLRNGALRLQGSAFAVTPAGKRFLSTLDIDAESLRGLRRSFAHECLDWTERHHHIGGSLGAALLDCFIELKWLTRMRETRAIRLTHAGERGIERVFSIRCAGLRTWSAMPPEQRAL